MNIVPPEKPCTLTSTAVGHIFQGLCVLMKGMEGRQKPSFDDRMRHLLTIVKDELCCAMIRLGRKEANSPAASVFVWLFIDQRTSLLGANPACLHVFHNMMTSYTTRQEL